MKDEHKYGKFNSGYDESQEIVLGSDYIAGGASGIDYFERVSHGDWTKYLNPGEHQKFTYFDSMGCVSFSNCNAVEAQVNYYIMEGLIEVDKIKDWLHKDGYADLSDRGLAKMSNTRKTGNSMGMVAYTGYKKGYIPQSMWPNKLSGKFTWDKFYEDIPKDIQNKGLEFLQYFDVKYERLPSFGITHDILEKYLRMSPIQVATAVCAGWSRDDVVKSCNEKAKHAWLLPKLTPPKYINCHDHYEPFDKKLAWDYKIPYGMNIVVTPKASILKDKTMKGKLYKTKDSTTCYELWADDKYHPVSHGSYVENKWGGWNNVDVKTITIPDTKKGSMIGEYPWFAKAIANLFKK